MTVYLLLFLEAHSFSENISSLSTKEFYNPLKSNLWSFQNTKEKHYLNPIVLTFLKTKRLGVCSIFKSLLSSSTSAMLRNQIFSLHVHSAQLSKEVTNWDYVKRWQQLKHK